MLRKRAHTYRPRPTCSFRFCQRPHGLSSKISLSSSLSSSFPSDPDFLSGTDIVILPPYSSRFPAQSSFSFLPASFLLDCLLCVVVDQTRRAAAQRRSAACLRSEETPPSHRPPPSRLHQPLAAPLALKTSCREIWILLETGTPQSERIIHTPFRYKLAVCTLQGRWRN